MTKIDQYEFPDELYYTQEHVWARIADNVATVGVSQFGQELAGEIVYVEVPMVGREIKQGEPFMSMESGKWVGRIKSPVSGKIIEANEEIEWESTLVNEDPYGQGWLAKVEMADAGELDNLLRADSKEFAALIAADREKYDK
jgi:glycine cleavage system H protein